MIPAAAVLTEITQTITKKFTMPSLVPHKSSSLRNVYSSSNQYHVPTVRNDLVVNNERQTIIESCELNELFAANRVCAFPLTSQHYACLQTRIGQKLTLFNYDTKARWEVELLELYSPHEWATLMSFKPMAPIIVLEECMMRGCKIYFIKRIL